MEIDNFLRELKNYHATLVFNPWSEFDRQHDCGPEAPDIRTANLQRYLRLRRYAEYLFVAEGLGYQGGHFSGIAMTSERILLGHHATVRPEQVLAQWQYQRTSDPFCPYLNKKQREQGFNEPTATVVWNALAEQSLPGNKAVLWNIFPFHPYRPAGLLTNRTPEKKELACGVVYTKMLMTIFPTAKIVAIGQKASATLHAYGVACSTVPHPSMGGAGRFKQAVAELLRGNNGREK